MAINLEKAEKEINYQGNIGYNYKFEVENKIGYLFFKRVFDFILSSCTLVICVPLFIIIYLAIKIDSKGGPVFYIHKRVGKNGRTLNLYKFRSMINFRGNLEDILTPEQLNQYKTEFKIDNDPRVTKIGKFLRKTSLDELPQLLNIIKGELSIVGPRPVIEEEVQLYGVNKYKFLCVKPGLTGYWQANGRSNISYDERIKMELYYIDNCSFLFDIEIILKTVLEVLRGTGAC